jgi:hypothetical protein
MNDDLLAPNESSSPETPASVPPLEDPGMDFELPGIAQRRAQAQANRRQVRGKLWAAEPAIALAVGALIFVVLGPTGILLPMFGNDGGAQVVSVWIWILGALALFAAVAISGLRISALRRGKTDLTPRHLRGREIILILIAATLLALLWVAVVTLAPGR